MPHVWCVCDSLGIKLRTEADVFSDPEWSEPTARPERTNDRWFRWGRRTEQLPASVIAVQSRSSGRGRGHGCNPHGSRCCGSTQLQLPTPSRTSANHAVARPRGSASIFRCPKYLGWYCFRSHHSRNWWVSRVTLEWRVAARALDRDPGGSHPTSATPVRRSFVS